MRKLKKFTTSFCSLLLAASILLSSAAPAFAADSVLPEESSSQITQSEALTTPESAAPDSESIPVDSNSTPADSSSVPIEPDSNSVPTEPESKPDSNSTPADSSSVPADSSEPVQSEPTEEETPEKKPSFEMLAIAAFTPQAEILEDGQAKLSVTLNRKDVAVNYQWQVKKAAKVPELLFDYTNYSDTSYYFPYADITEADLLAINPDATWPGIEMYLAAVEAAGGDAAAVSIDNGAENTIIAQAEAATAASSGLELPNWQPIADATESTYIFPFDEENAQATYRCVITITDEAYLQQAAENTQDAYGTAAEDTSVTDVLPDSAPAAAPESSAATEPTQAIDEPENSPVGAVAEPALTIETQLITGEAGVPLPQISLFGLGAHTGVEQVRQDGPWITGLDSEMEYITANTLATHPEAALTIETQLIIVQAAQ